MPGVAGRRAVVKITGVAVAFVTEACTDAGAHTVYQITNAVKRVWDPTVPILVYKNAVLQAAALYTLNRLTGRITFLAAILVGDAVTVSGSYLPLTVAAGCRGYTWAIEQTVIDDTDYDSANTNGGFVDQLRSLFKVSGSLTRRWRMETYFESAIMAQNLFVIEFFPDRSVAPELIVWALMNKSDLSMVVAGTIDGNVGWTGVGDADLRVASLSTQ